MYLLILLSSLYLFCVLEGSSWLLPLYMYTIGPHNVIGRRVWLSFFPSTRFKVLVLTIYYDRYAVPFV